MCLSLCCFLKLLARSRSVQGRVCAASSPAGSGATPFNPTPATAQRGSGAARQRRSDQPTNTKRRERQQHGQTNKTEHNKQQTKKYTYEPTNTLHTRTSSVEPLKQFQINRYTHDCNSISGSRFFPFNANASGIKGIQHRVTFTVVSFVSEGLQEIVSSISH